MERLVMDTDVASRLQRNDLDPDYDSLLEGRILVLTFVTVAEMLRGAAKANWGARRMEGLEGWLSVWDVIHSDNEISRAWGNLVASREKVGRKMQYNDAWIAACCVASGFALATLNRKHFEDIEGLRLL